MDASPGQQPNDRVSPTVNRPLSRARPKVIAHVCNIDALVGFRAKLHAKYAAVVLVFSTRQARQQRLTSRGSQACIWDCSVCSRVATILAPLFFLDTVQPTQCDHARL